MPHTVKLCLISCSWFPLEWTLEEAFHCVFQKVADKGRPISPARTESVRVFTCVHMHVRQLSIHIHTYRRLYVSNRYCNGLQ